MGYLYLCSIIENIRMLAFIVGFTGVIGGMFVLLLATIDPGIVDGGSWKFGRIMVRRIFPICLVLVIIFMFVPEKADMLKLLGVN